jgi:hypothetical protein
MFVKQLILPLFIVCRTQQKAKGFEDRKMKTAAVKARKLISK